MDDEQIELSADRAWQDQANCLGVDPDLFFPERGASTREAKEVCKGCVVRDECLVRAALDDLAALEHQDLVRAPNRRQPMRND